MQKIPELFGYLSGNSNRPGNTGVVHLAIDVQEKYINKIPHERGQKFSTRISDFCTLLYGHGIPTIHVGFGEFKPPKRNEFYQAGDIAAGDPSVLTRIMGLDFAYPLNPAHPVCVKFRANTLAHGASPDPDPLSVHLASTKTHTLMFTGMNTGACVHDTCAEALKLGFNVIGLCDLMEDVHLSGSHHSTGRSWIKP